MKTAGWMFAITVLYAAFAIIAYGGPLFFTCPAFWVLKQQAIAKEQKELSEALEAQLHEIENLMDTLCWTDEEKQKFFNFRKIQANERGGATAALVYQQFIRDHYPKWQSTF